MANRIDPQKVVYVRPFLGDGWCRVYYDGLYYGEIYQRRYMWETREGHNAYKGNKNRRIKFSAAKYLIENVEGKKPPVNNSKAPMVVLDRHLFPGLIELHEELKMKEECENGYCHMAYPMDSSEVASMSHWKFRRQ